MAITAKTFGEMYAAQMFWADGKNGQVGNLPALTADDTLQLVEYWKLQGVRNGGLHFVDWYDMSLAALGYEKAGDKFRHRPGAMLSASDTQKVWEVWLPPFVAQLDAIDPNFIKKPQKFVPDKAGAISTVKRFRRVAKAAWARMKKEKKIQPIPMPKPMPTPDKIFGRATDILVIAVIAYLALTES